MAAGGAESSLALGFYASFRHPERGWYGGYLALNLLGRPLEFHCSAPLKASRTQEILYGPTLESYLVAEQIGKRLVENLKGSLRPSLILVNRPAALSLGVLIDPPVLYVPEASEEDVRRPDDLIGVAFRNQEAYLDAAAAHHRSAVESIWQRLSPSWELSEPFQRIREALEEAHRGARAA
jgi:hypothetical protein